MRFVIFLSALCSALLLSTLAMATHWQNPANYTRYPSGATPANPITLSVDFDNESGCPYQSYQFWAYQTDGTPMFAIGDETTLQSGHLEHTAYLPDGVGIDRVFLICMDTNHNRYDGTSNLESGTPAFTPYDAPPPTPAHWQNPANYTRYPSSATPGNPVTFYVEFNNETGCPYQTYQFWAFEADGTPMFGIGDEVTMQDGMLSETAYMPDGVGIDRVFLICMDTSHDRYDGSTDLESGTPAFTPYYPTSAHWQNPVNYTRYPSGTTPSNPLQFSVEFNNETGCPYQTYQFWAFEADGTPMFGIGNETTLQNGRLEQIAYLPHNVGIDRVFLICMDTNHNRYDGTSNLESGTPAFTPYDPPTPAHWQNPANYTRYPSGTTPDNPITFSVDFNNETGCPYQTYQFWAFEADGTPMFGIGNETTMQDGRLTETAYMPDGVGIDRVFLICMDTNHNRYDGTSNLESGTPAFTPYD